MKCNRYLIPFTMTILITLTLAVGLLFLVSKGTLPPTSLESEKARHSVLKSKLEARNESLKKLSAEEGKLQNYQKLWEQEAKHASNVENCINALNRLAARSNILFREITPVTENWDLRRTLDLELSGNFESLFDWMNTVENAFFNIKFTKSEWLRIDEELMQLALTTEFFTHETI